MTPTLPTLGQDVHYVLSAIDAQQVNDRRKPKGAGAGAQAFALGVGNDAAAGDICVAKVVRVFPGAEVVNLQVFLDGDDTLWRTNVREGLSGEQGTWHWPPRA